LTRRHPAGKIEDVALKKRNAFVDDGVWDAFIGAIPPGVAKAAAWAAAMYAFALVSPADRLRLLGFVSEWEKAPPKHREAVFRRHIAELAKRYESESDRRQRFDRYLKKGPDWEQARHLKTIAELLEKLVKSAQNEGAETLRPKPAEPP